MRPLAPMFTLAESYDPEDVMQYAWDCSRHDYLRATRNATMGTWLWHRRNGTTPVRVSWKKYRARLARIERKRKRREAARQRRREAQQRLVIR